MSRWLMTALITGVALVNCGVCGQAAAATGRIDGVVKDQSGGVLRGASVEIASKEPGTARSAVTDQDGRYSFEALPVGRYKLSVALPGFASVLRSNLAVAIDQAMSVDVVLPLEKRATTIVVTAPAMSRPLVVETDPRAPRQPIPAHDGADYLKTIPGFSIIRKGGTDGDPVFRGMAGSRVAILLDGQQILGGCGGRMDPPTAYVFPAAYDRITVLKGPQTVQYGPDTSAATVLFERDMKRDQDAGIASHGAITGGSYGRHDEMLDVRAHGRGVYAQGIATRSHTDDYRDGNGAAVHSLYTRWSGNGALGWTPAETTRLELSLARSNGEAAYADRAMDGRSFARDNVGFKLDTGRIAPFVGRVQAQAYYNHIDHVMDNFSLRPPGSAYSVNNPDRRTVGGRAAATLLFGDRTTVVVGGDTRRDVHRGHGAMGQASAELATSAYQAAPRVEDMRFSQVGLFSEATRVLTPHSRLQAGLRTDWHEAVDGRPCVAATMCPGASPLKNDTLGATDRKALGRGFGRLEVDVKGAGTLYAGLGHVERFPDYWERMKQDPVTLRSAFLSTRPEKLTQLDAGLLWKAGAWSGSASAFRGKVKDYVLIRWSPTPTLTRNVDVTTSGVEADLSRRFGARLRAEATLAYVRSDNDTDGKPLAQQPPIEGRLSVSYQDRGFSPGSLVRLVGSQSRVDVGSGNIVSGGMDIGPTASFAVVSVNAGYRAKRNLLLSSGVDNLLNTTYAEHISRAGAAVPGFVQTTRISEPGWTLWMKVDVSVD